MIQRPRVNLKIAVNSEIRLGSGKSTATSVKMEAAFCAVMAAHKLLTSLA